MTENIRHIVQKRGKVALVALLSVVSVFILSVLFDTQEMSSVHSVQATSTATTTVRVLNTPPAWTTTAYEKYDSSTTTPTNVGTSTVWTAQATDSNGEPYYLLVCMSSSTPIAIGGQPPVCGGGSTDQWAISALTPSGTFAEVSTTTQVSWNERNPWYAYICDSNAGDPSCNDIMYNGLDDGTADPQDSPFIVNHPASFTVAADDSPTLPGDTVTWTTTATDTVDTLRGTDSLQLFVCKSNDFDVSIPGCGPSGAWATSTLFAAGNPSTSTVLAIPLQDTDHDAYVYVVDEFNLAATGAAQGSNTTLTVSNATPYVASSTITVYDVGMVDTNLRLTTEEGETENFVMRFEVVDDNSCLNAASGNEITDVDINVFRSGVGLLDSTGCDEAGEYNANNCYTDTTNASNWSPTCTQVPGDCLGATQASVEWECTFPLWYIADPTDVGSLYAGEDWRGAARATDDDAATTAYYSVDDEAADGASQLLQFLSFRATGSPIAYGSLEPGDFNPLEFATTTLYATGNTGLDQYLSGDAMCVTYPTCSNDPTDTIYVPYQHYSLTEGAAFAAGTQLSTSTAPAYVDVTVLKTTATSTPTSDDTFWAIQVPSSITFAGDYIGRNYIDAAVSPSGEW